MTNEEYIRHHMDIETLAKTLLYHWADEEWEWDCFDELRLVTTRDMWRASDGEVYDDIEEAIAGEMEWLKQPYESRIL